MITDLRSFKDTNNERTRVTNTNINYNKEIIPASNAYPYESNNNTNTQHDTINIGRDKNIRRSNQTNIRHSKKDNKIMNQRTTTAEHKRESMQFKTVATRDRYRQTKNKKQQQNILERTCIVRNSKNTIHACSNINQCCSINHVEIKHDNVPQQKVIKPSDGPT